MKFLIVGRGSMARRRIRGLGELGYMNVTTYDITDEETFEEVLDRFKPDVLIVSSPPLTKQRYINLANERGISCFIEADIQSYNGFYHPSRTMVYHPAVKRIKQLLNDGLLGNAYTFNYHLGQFLPLWHKGVDYSKYYAAQKETSGVLEMVAFEMSWLSYLLGTPFGFKHFIDKTLDLKNVTADDVIASALSFVKGDRAVCGTMLIDTVSSPATRELKIIGEKGTILWNWENSFISFQFPDGLINNFMIKKGKAVDGYNENICEKMYVDEIRDFISAIKGESEYQFSRELESRIMNLISRIGKIELSIQSL